MCAALHRREARTTAFRVQKKRENDGRLPIGLSSWWKDLRTFEMQAQTQNSVTSFYKFGPQTYLDGLRHVNETRRREGQRHISVMMDKLCYSYSNLKLDNFII